MALSLQQGQDPPSVLSDLELARQLQQEEYQQHHPHPHPAPPQLLPAQVTRCPPRGVWGSLQVPVTPCPCPCPHRRAGVRPESGGSGSGRIWTVPSCSTACRGVPTLHPPGTSCGIWSGHTDEG